jgi:hypothetical protein
MPKLEEHIATSTDKKRIVGCSYGYFSNGHYVGICSFCRTLKGWDLFYN